MTKIILVLAFAALVYLFVTGKLTKAPKMPRSEAAKLLGLSPDADTESVLDAHRRLIAKVHPDAGGSAELAARINQARDTLLRSS